MTRGRHAKPSRANQKIGAAVIAGAAGLGTMFSMVPASFADALPSNNETQNSSSRVSSYAQKLSGLYGAKAVLQAADSSLGSLALDATGYQTQAKQQAVAQNLSSLTKSLEGILETTPYMAKLSSVQSALEGVEDTLKTPDLPNSDLEGPQKTQGKLQGLVKQLQSIINDASAQYGTELKNAIDEYNNDNLPATESGVKSAVKAAQNVYNTANAANNPDLDSANNTFSTNAGNAETAAGSASEPSSILGKASSAAANAQKQLENVENKLKALYDDSASPASGTLVTDAQNFDSWAHSWIKANWPGSGNLEDYSNQLEGLIQDITEWEADGSLTVASGKQAEADTVVRNLKIVQQGLASIHTLMANCDTASMPPDEAWSTAWKYGLMGLNGEFRTLHNFLQNSYPLEEGRTSTVPEGVGTPYGGTEYDEWPAQNPFEGSKANTLWSNIENVNNSFRSNLPRMLEPSAEPWEQDYSNYKYLQSVEPYAQQISQDASQALSYAQAAAAKVSAAKALAEGNTGDAASDSLAAAQAEQDIQDALQDVAQANGMGSQITSAMNKAFSEYESATSSSPSVKIDGSTVSIPQATDEGPLYAQKVISQVQGDFENETASANQALSGSASGTGSGGLLGDAKAWQKAIVTQNVFNDAQKAYNDVSKVEQDLKNVEASPNPGAAINGLKQLQSDLTPLINSTQNAIDGMEQGSKALGSDSPYTQGDVSGAQTPLNDALPLSSASNADNPIQKAIGNGNVYNIAHPIVVGLNHLQPTVHTLIGQGSEPGLSQKILGLPWQEAHVSHLPSTPLPSAPSSGSASVSGIPAQGISSAPHAVSSSFPEAASGGTVQVQTAKPSDNLATTGSDIAAATIGAAALLAAGVAAELLKKKGAKRNR